MAPPTAQLVPRGAGFQAADNLLVRQRSLSHNNAVYWAAFSADGKKLATASLDNTVKLWNVSDGQHVGTLKGHADGVAFVAFLPDGRTATASLDKTLKVWPADGGPATLTFTGHQGDYLACAAVSRTGHLLASGGFDKTVRLWDAQSGAALATLNGHTETVQCVAISCSGRVVASGGDDRSIRLWDADSKQPIRTLTGNERTVEALAFRPNSPKRAASASSEQEHEMLVSASGDATIRFWTPDGQALATIDTQSGRIKCLAFSPDGELLASGGADGVIRFWNVADRRELSATPAHYNTVYCVAFNPAGTLLASAGFDRSIHLWDVRRA